MSRRNETSGVELVVVGVFAFCLAVVAWLMKTFDVEWQTALETAPGLIVWLLVVGAGIFFGIKMETGLVRWGAPLAIALLIPVFKPILKEAAGVRETGGLVFDDMVSWYGTGWGMSLMFFGILIIGYGLLYWWHRSCYAKRLDAKSVYSVFQRFPCTEGRYFGCRDFDLFTGLRVAAGTSRTFTHGEGTETYQSHVIPCFQRVGNGSDYCV